MAGVLFAEAAEKWHLRHHIARPTIFLALTTLALRLFHGRLAGKGEGRRSLRLTDDHLVVGGRPFRRFTARWADIAEITVTDRQAEVRTHDGRQRRINLSDLENAEQDREALMHAQQRLEPAAS